MTTKKKTQKGGRGEPREAVHVDLDLAAVSEAYDRTARRIASLYGKDASLPGWLSDLILLGLETASDRTGVEGWTDSEKGFNLRGLADLLSVSSLREYRFEFEPKKDLPELINAVLRHPDTPANLYNAIGDAVSDWHVDDTDPAYIRLALANLAAVQREIAEDEKGGE